MSSPRLTVLSNLVRAMRIAIHSGGPSLGTRLAVLPRLFRDVARGSYPGLTRTQLFGMVAALGYLLMPFDLAPEVLLGVFGMVDDAVVASWLVAGIVNATEDYLGWETHEGRAGQPVSVPSHVVP